MSARPRTSRSASANYARPTGYDARIARMIAATVTMEFVTTKTETEALLLEANLIKRLRPRFNVLLRDDKSFPYILITSDHWAPQILKHRGARTRQGHYFGPFANAGAVNRTINALQRAFLLRSCSDSFFEARTRPCLLHQIKRCSAPCTQEIDFAGYAELVREADAFLSGRSRSVQKELATEMDKASAAMDFEHAAVYRDRSGGAVGGHVAPGHQSAQRRGSRRVRRAPGRRLQLRRGVLLPHRAELGQPRLFPESRPHVRPRRDFERVPGAVLRRQAAAAAHPGVARLRGARAAGGRLEHQERAQGRGLGAAARRAQGAGDARAGQCARGAGAQARRHVLAAEIAQRADRNLRAAAQAPPHRGLRQQPHRRLQPRRRHDRRGTGGLPQEPVSQVQYPLAGSCPRRRLRHDARGVAAAVQAAAGGGAAPEPGRRHRRRPKRRGAVSTTSSRGPTSC